MPTITTDDRLDAYFDAWNAHASADVAAAFAPDGTYTDPICNGRTVTPVDLGGHVARLAEAFPDFRFDTDRPAWSDCRTAYVSWVLCGTNTGPYNGLPPSGRTIELPGVDIIDVADDGIHRVVGHFDRQTMSTQLGLEVVVQPTALGPFEFGTSVAAFPERSAPPAALAVTWIEARTPAEADEVRRLSRPIVAALCDIPGYLGGVGVALGNRLYTVTAWQDRADIRLLVELPEHQVAADRFLQDDFCSGAFTGVWPSSASQSWWQRCPTCATSTNPLKERGRCSACSSTFEELRPW